MKQKLLWLILSCAVLACGLIENAIPTSQPIAQSSMPSSTPVSTFCEVRTGVGNGGSLNLRAGPGVGYASIRILHEGETIVLANLPAHDGWQSVKADSIAGWVNANYIDCEVKQ